MLSLALLTLGLAAIGVCVEPAIRAPGGLEVFLSTPANQVASASEIRVVATVKNVGDDDLKVLKFESVLDNEFSTRSFIVTKDGKEVSFTGSKALISTDHLSEDDFWVVIPSGGNVTAEHDVSALYDFSAAGRGTFTFEPVSSFQVIGVGDTVETTPNPTRINIYNAHSISITVTDVSKREPNFKERSVLNCTDGTKRTSIGYGYLEAKALASLAAAHISYHGGNNQLYQDYFGSSPISQVIVNYTTIANEATDWRFLTCDYDPMNKCGLVSVYFYHADTIFCPAYFNYLPLDALCKGRTRVEQGDLLSAFTLRALAQSLNGATELNLSCQDAKKLLSPEKLKNASNYSCFASQIYYDTKCSK